MTDKEDTSHLYPERVLTISERAERARKAKSVYGGNRFHRTAKRRAEKHETPEEEKWIRARLRRPKGNPNPWLTFLAKEWEAMSVEQRSLYVFARSSEPQNYYQLRDRVRNGGGRGIIRHSSLTPPRRF